MSIRFLPDLVGTLQSYFRIAGIRLKNTADTLLSIRNKADTEYRDVAARGVELRLAAGTNKVALAIASEPAGDLTLNLPVADGATNQALCTDGSGQLSFVTVATGANAVKAEDQVIAFGSTSPVAIVALPAGATVQRVTVEVETAFDGTPSLSVGLAGDTAKYFGATDVDLATAAVYEAAPMVEEAGAVSPIVTYAAGSASVGSARVTVQWVVPG